LLKRIKAKENISQIQYGDVLVVYALIDALGDSTVNSHQYGIERMLQAGVVPITLEALVSEWMHDWNNPKSGELVKEVYSRYGSMIGLR
jgi:hypothetical protein